MCGRGGRTGAPVSRLRVVEDLVADPDQPAREMRDGEDRQADEQRLRQGTAAGTPREPAVIVATVQTYATVLGAAVIEPYAPKPMAPDRRCRWRQPRRGPSTDGDVDVLGSDGAHRRIVSGRDSTTHPANPPVRRGVIASRRMPSTACGRARETGRRADAPAIPPSTSRSSGRRCSPVGVTPHLSAHRRAVMAQAAALGVPRLGTDLTAAHPSRVSAGKAGDLVPPTSGEANLSSAAQSERPSGSHSPTPRIHGGAR